MQPSEVDTRPKTLSVAGAKAYAGLSEWRIRKLISDSDIIVRFDGTKILVDRASLDRWLDSLPSERATK